MTPKHGKNDFWAKTFRSDNTFNFHFLDVFFVKSIRSEIFGTQEVIFPTAHCFMIVCLLILNVFEEYTIAELADLCLDFYWLRKARQVVSTGIVALPSVIICLEFQTILEINFNFC